MLKRISAVKKILKQKELDALIISSSTNIAYLSGFSGFDFYERGGYAFLTQNNLYLLANLLYAEEAIHEAKGAKIIAITKDQKLISSLQEIINQEKIKTVGLEDNLTVSEYKVFKKLKNVKLKLTDEIIEKIRIIKDKFELESLKNACRLTDLTYSNILKSVRMNMTEIELAWKIEKFIKEHGGELAFPTIVAFGKNSSTPHHKTTNNKLTENSIILIDFGAKVNGYCADMTRTLFFGKATEKFKKMYETVLQALNKSFLAADKNLTLHQIDRLARSHIESQDYPAIPHSVGHGVGLEVHELPHIAPGFKEKIKRNTTFTIEPGIYIPGFGGVRIEDTVYFDGKKIVSLTQSPKNLIGL